ncbi:MAG: DUF3048 domain-containing protein [Lachnospiraceae bacterium]|jgi:hypothetical protein|nr:DUF3048 domain-containing protein [Lachnospiraceae bacterium]
MRKKYLSAVLLLLGVTMLMLGGCRNEGEVITPLPPIQEISPPVVDPGNDINGEEPNGVIDIIWAPENMLNGVPIVGVREEIGGMYQSYLTGEWKDASVAKRRPIAIVLSNNRPALPHYGISQYSIMFEAAVEGRTSRLVGYFEDYDALDRIGPVRSARDYFVYDSNGKQGIFTHWGLAVIYSADLINSDRVDNVSQSISGVRVSATEAFIRVNRPGYAVEYTGYLDIPGYNRAVERLGYRTHYDNAFVPQFTFAAEGTRVTYDNAPDITVIRPGGTTTGRGGYGNTNPYFQYNEEEGIYYRYQSGEPLLDEMNNEHVSAANIVFQFAYGEVRDPNDYLIFRMHHDGDKAIVFTNGKMIEGTWTRMRDTVPAKFHDLDGNEIILNQGRTWICMIWDMYADEIVLE